jgi:hypothetical protein
MLDEHLAAQRRVLPRYGLSGREIERLQARLSFARAEDFLRLGDKRGALGLMRASLRGADARTAARLLLRLLTPRTLARRREARRRRRAAARHGTVEV